MEDWVKEILAREKKKRKIPLEVKTRNTIHYLYKSTTAWDKKTKKRKRISKYIGKITRKGVIEANSVKLPPRTIYEYSNGKLLSNIANDITPALENEFPNQYTEIIAASIIKLFQPTPIRLLKSKWENYLSKTHKHHYRPQHYLKNYAK